MRSGWLRLRLQQRSCLPFPHLCREQYVHAVGKLGGDGFRFGREISLGAGRPGRKDRVAQVCRGVRRCVGRGVDAHHLAWNVGRVWIKQALDGVTTS